MMNQNKKYYKVTVERGHLGAHKDLETTFYFFADNAYDAICMAKRMPGVKHHKMPINAKEITEEEYNEGRKISAYHKEKQEFFKSK